MSKNIWTRHFLFIWMRQKLFWTCKWTGQKLRSCANHAIVPLSTKGGNKASFKPLLNIIKIFLGKWCVKPIHWVKSSAQWSLFQRMTADVSSARLERFGENDPFFKKRRSCRTAYSMNNFKWCLGFWSTKLISEVTKIDLQFRASKS